MTVLYLTNNPQLAGTARILTSWLLFGREQGIGGCVVVPKDGQLAAWLSAKGVTHVESRMPWLNRRRPLPALVEAWRIARWARRHGVDLVHCNEHDVYPFGVLVARLLGRPVVCHVRFRLDGGFAAWAFGGWRRPDALLWTSRRQKEDSRPAMNDVVPEHCQHLVPLGPDPAVFRPAEGDRRALKDQFDIRDGEIAIGTATAFRPVKRLEDFVALTTALAERFPEVVGLVSGGAVPGEEAYRREIEQQIAASGLGRRLRWLGHLEPIDPLLRSLDVFVSTSEYETFGNSVCEAMACGLPVAAYAGGSVQEVIGDAGVVVADRDLAGLIEETARFVTDAGARARFGRLARERVSREFDPRVSFGKLSAVYDRVTAGRS